MFDAHDKNVVRSGDVLIPFDIVMCDPAEGFLQFIEVTLIAGHRVKSVRTVTSRRY